MRVSTIRVPCAAPALLSLLVSACGSGAMPPSTPPNAPAASTTPSTGTASAMAPVPAGDAAWFPLVDGAVYEYDARFGTKEAHEVRRVRLVNLPAGRFFYFVEQGADPDSNPSIGSNAFGLGAYRITERGIETADVYFRDDLAKITAESPQLALAFPIQEGAKTTLHGGKQLDTIVFGHETITVPAGTFDCLRLDQREVWPQQTYEGAVWLARGVGTVKRVYVTGRTEVLTAYRLQ